MELGIKQCAVGLLETASTRTSYIAIVIVLCSGLWAMFGAIPTICPQTKSVIFIIVAFAGLCFAGGLAVNLCYPKIGLWPPPAVDTWQFWLVWVSYTVSGVGIAVVGVLDWGTLGLDQWLFRLTGVVMLLIAVPFNEWGMRTLSDQQTLGLQGELVTGGPYQYSRNPQYVAEILSYLALVLITNSLLGAVLGAFIILWFLMAPLAEEPWLARQFGTQFEAYTQQVPRFLGIVHRN